MNKTIPLLFAASLGLAAGPAWADPDEAPVREDPAAEQARIPFVDHGGIRNWRAAEGSESILIEGRNRQWYRADFNRRCIGLNFSEAVGFETRGADTFDRFGVVVTRDDRCHVRSLVAIPDPDAVADADAESDHSAH